MCVVTQSRVWRDALSFNEKDWKLVSNMPETGHKGAMNINCLSSVHSVSCLMVFGWKRDVT